MTQSSAPVSVPSSNDVLCGRGNVAFHHEGNRRFRVLVASHLSEYSKAKTKRQKIGLVRSVTRIVLRRGGRFLSQDPTTHHWFDIGTKASYRKVGHSLRDSANDKIKCIKAISEKMQAMSATTQTGHYEDSLDCGLLPMVTPIGTNDQLNVLQLGGLVGGLWSLHRPPSSLVMMPTAPVSNMVSLNITRLGDVSAPSITGSFSNGDAVTESSDSSDHSADSECCWEEESLDAWCPLSEEDTFALSSLGPNPVVESSLEACFEEDMNSCTQGLSEGLKILSDVDLQDLDEYCSQQEQQKALLLSTQSMNGSEI